MGTGSCEVVVGRSSVDVWLLDVTDWAEAGQRRPTSWPERACSRTVFLELIPAQAEERVAWSFSRPCKQEAEQDCPRVKSLVVHPIMGSL